MLSLRLEKARQPRAFRVDEVAEDVHVAALVHGGDFDAVNEGDPRTVCSLPHLREAGDRVVVGDAHHRDPRVGDACDQVGRGEPSVRRGCVEVKIDQRDAACRALAGFAWGLRLVWRRSRARYSRISISRCSRSSSANSRKICLPSESSKRSP